VSDFPILTALIVTPVLGALVIAVLPNRRPEYIRLAGYVFTVATLALAGWLLYHFQTGHTEYQFTESERWIGDLGVRYSVGVDGISLFMVVLTALLFPIGLLASSAITDRTKSFFAWMLALEAALIGVFLALDLVTFFVFFEFVLVPMYFIIVGWGHERRTYAALKFFVFTMAGSAFLLVGILSLAFLHSDATGHLTFDLPTLVAWAPHGLDPGTAKWLFMAFFAAFAVKVPLFPLHTWLPDAHTEAPTAGSVILAGVLLKMGAYGFLRFALPLFPQAAVDLAPLLLVLGTIGIVYGAVVATMQRDLKRLIAYSSVAHMGFVIIGIFALTTQGLDGGVFTMISHGLTTSALFLLVGFLYDRRHTHLIPDFGGLWKSVPILGGLFCAAAFASIGLPGFSGFVGEFLALLGTFIVDKPYAIISAVGVILAAVYLLWAFQRSFMGEPSGDNAKLTDLSVREICCVVPLLAISLLLGLYPKPVLDRVEPSVNKVICQVERGSNYKQPKVASGHVVKIVGRGGAGGSADLCDAVVSK
jgi:NADH-quinone oxidoreductase subunit M